MVIRHTRRILVLSTTLVLSISILNMQETSASLGDQSRIVNPESMGLALDSSIPRNGSAAVYQADSFKLAGNAPCNPEQEVCNK